MTSKWVVLALAVLCGAGATFAELDTSGWPSASAGCAMRKAALNTAAGPAVKTAWQTNSNTLTNDPAGTGGIALSADGYLYFRDNGTATPIFTEMRASDGAIIKQRNDLALVLRSGCIVTPTRVYVSTAPDATPTIKGYDRTDPNLSVAATMTGAGPQMHYYRSIQVGSVAYHGRQRIYGESRAATSSAGSFVDAFDPGEPNGTWVWQLGSLTDHSGGFGGLCQLGPLWVDTGTGKQMLAVNVANASAAKVYIIRDDDTVATVVATLDTNAFAGNQINGAGALTTDGTGIIYCAANTSGKACLYKVSTAGALVWSVSQAAAAVSDLATPPAIIDNLIYVPCAGGKLLCVQDNGTTYTVKWLVGTGTTLDLGNIAAEKTVAGKTYIYVTAQGTPGKLIVLEDTGSTAVIRGIKSLPVVQSFGGSAPSIDSAGNVYVVAGDLVSNPGMGHVLKLAPGVGTPPVANAGPDITAPCCAQATVSGSGSAGAGHYIVEYIWSNVSTGAVLADGPNPVTQLTPPCGGAQTLSLVVVDDDGFVSNPDTMTVTPPAPLTANAGPDQTVPGSCGTTSAVVMAGSGTGGIVLQQWQDISGTVLASGFTPTLYLYPGLYNLTLTVSDGVCVTASDGVTISVGGLNPDPPANLPLSAQIDVGSGPTIVAGSLGSYFLEVPAAATGPGWPIGPWTRQWLRGGSYHTPRIYLWNACYDTVNLSNVTISIETRYLQDPSSYLTPSSAYLDAGVGLSFWDVNGKRGALNTVPWSASDATTNGKWWISGPNHRTPDPNDPNRLIYSTNVLNGMELPPWLTYSNRLYFDGHADPQGTQAGFDPTKVASIEIFGTDTYGVGYDFVDLRNLTITAATAPGKCGDANCDGLVNNGDIDAFIEAITNSAQYQLNHPGCSLLNSDANKDGIVNNGDIDAFVSVITGGPGCGH